MTSNLPGSYRLRVCTLPTDITSQKHGYEPVTQRVTQTSLSIQMACPGKSYQDFREFMMTEPVHEISNNVAF